MTEYLGKLAHVLTSSQDLIEPTQYGDLVPLLDQDLMRHAHVCATQLAAEMSAALSRRVVARPEKRLGRVQQKLARDLFKAQCDLVALYVPCEEPTAIEALVAAIETFCLGQPGGRFQRRPAREPDIVAFCYGYIPRFGFLFEVQVSHPVARYVFARDSALRDGQPGLVDLWSNHFYEHLRAELLAPAGRPLLAELYALYADKTPEPELVSMVAAIAACNPAVVGNVAGHHDQPPRFAPEIPATICDLKS
jgi:hypothetical protein